MATGGKGRKAFDIWRHIDVLYFVARRYNAFSRTLNTHPRVRNCAQAAGAWMWAQCTNIWFLGQMSFALQAMYEQTCRLPEKCSIILIETFSRVSLGCTVLPLAWSTGSQTYQLNQTSQRRTAPTSWYPRDTSPFTTTYVGLINPA